MKRNLLLITLFTLCLSTWTTQAQTVLGERNALHFDGTNDYVEIPFNAAFNSSEVTIEAWVKPEATSQQWSRIFSSSTGNQFELTQRSDGESKFGAYTLDGVLKGVINPTTWTAGQWYHVAMVMDGTDMFLYVDGISVGTPVSVPTGSSTNNRYIGSKGTAANHYGKGEIDEVRMWNVARSATEIMASYRGELCGSETNLVAYWDFNQGTAGGDNSGITTLDDKTSNNHDGTLTNFAKTGSTSNFVTSAAIQKNGLHFDGTNDNISTAITSVSTTITVEAWVKLDDVSPVVGFNNLVAKWITGSNDDQDFVLRFRDVEDKFVFRVENNPTVGEALSTTVAVADTWYHVAGTYDGTDVKIYINGTLETTHTISNALSISATAVYIGSAANNEQYIEGTIDEVRIWSTARTAGEISANYQSEITSTTSDLTAYYKFNQGDSDGTNTNVTTAVDLSSNCNHGTLNNFALTGSTSNWSGGAAALPVDMTFFRALTITEGSLLKWQTASEVNNEGFEIERSANGYHWEYIGFAAGRGTTFELQDYQFTDTKPYKGINYYRLKQMDWDGNFEYSEIVNVMYHQGKDLQKLKVYPNPVKNDEFTLYLPENEEETIPLQLYDYTGKLLQQQLLYDNESTIDIGQLLPGIYLVKVQINGQHLVERIVVQ